LVLKMRILNLYSILGLVKQRLKNEFAVILAN